MTLRRRILLGVLILGILPLVVAAVMVHRTLTPFLEADGGRDVQDFVARSARSLDTFMRQRSSEMRTFASEPIMLEGSPQAIAARLDQLSLLTFFFDGLYLLEPGGRVVAATDPAAAGSPVTAVFPELAPYIARARNAAGGTVFVSDFSDLAPVSRDRLAAGTLHREDLRLKLVTPVTDEHDRTKAVLLGVLSPMGVGQVISDLDDRTVGDESAYLLSPDGLIIATEDAAAALMRPHHDWGVLRDRVRNASGRAGVADYTSVRGRRVLSGFAVTSRLGGASAGWVVVSTAPYQDVMAPAIDVMRGLLGLMGVIVFAATAVGLGAARAVVRPIDELTATVRELAAGRLDARAKVAGTDETALLARTLNDMAEARQQAEAAQSRFLAILEATPDFVGFASAETAQIQYINPAGRAMVGLPPDAPLDGVRIFQVHPDWTNRMLREEILPAASRDGVWTGECAFLHRDGHEIPVLMVLLSHRGEDGRVERFSTVSRDITARHRADEELRAAMRAAEEATRAKGEFLATMSHEIRTPMNGVLGTLGLLLDTDLAPRQRELASIAISSADALLRIINDILDASKIESGRLTIEPIPFDMQTVAEEVGEMFAMNLRHKPIELVIRYSPGMPRRYIGDAGRIRQVLANLVGNAIKFTERGHVVVQIEPLPHGPGGSAGGIRVSVQDTGIGIEPGTIDRLFQRFVQADASTTRRFGGSGLGLAISRSLVELMGGAIGASSRPGEGSTFWFTLPLAEDTSPAGTRVREASPLAGLRILVVDDHPVNRLTLTEQVRGWHAQADATASGPEALAMLRAADAAGTPYDVALLDHHMPDMDGVMLGAEMRADPALREVMTFLLTSVDSDRTALMRDGGFRACFTKPVRPSVLLDGLTTAWGVRAEEPGRAGPPERPARNAPAAPTFRARVLVADDNATNLRVAQLRLEGAGCHVDLAGNGREAVDMIRELPYDLVLMDCEMPEMDGFAATAAIRQAEAAADRSTGAPPARDLGPHGPARRSPHLPIVAMTASAMAGDRERCLAAGMDDYLSKPLEVAALMAVLERWLPPPTGATADGGMERAAAPAAGALDPATIAGLRTLGEANGAGVFEMIFEGFLRDARSYTEVLERGCAAGDIAAVHGAAHALRGASGTIGALAVAAAAKQIEKARDGAAFAPLMAVLQHELRRASEEIETLLAERRRPS